MKSRWVVSGFNYQFTSSLLSSFLRNRCLSLRNFSLYTTNGGIAVNYAATSRLLSLCGREGHLGVGSSLHAYIIKHSEHFDFRDHCNIRNVLVVWNSLVFMYSNCGKLYCAAKVFDRMPMKDTISWNSLISGYLRIEEFETGFRFFKRMHSSGDFQFDTATLTAVLSACDKADLLSVIKLIHCLAFLSGYEQETPVANALITSYFKCGCHNSGRRVFDELSDRNIITWTAMISGLAQRHFYEESLKFFSKMRSGSVAPNSLTYTSLLLACSGLRALDEGRQLHGLVLKSGFQSDLCIESALMDIYSKCNSMEDACQIFEAAEMLDEVSLTVILVGLAQNGFEEEAVQFFVKMVKLGVVIDPNMVSAILGAFGMDTTLAFGRQIHSFVIKKNFGVNVFVSNGLINMYSKCGNLEESVEVFHQTVHKNSVSWNSIIAAFARHGHGLEALQLYDKMQLEGVEPTDVTFLSLLHACSHIGSVEKGMEFLDLMTNLHGFSPRTEHYACVVDLLGRAGCLNEAKRFIEGLQVDPGVLTWQALLGACSIHGDSTIGRYAADHLLLAAPESPTPYVLMANIYSSEGRWEERAKVIKKMKEMKVKKEAGVSWIELEKKVHSFVVADRTHPQSEIIYHVLEQLIRLMNDEGYVPDDRFLHYDLDQDCKQFCRS